MSDEAVSGTVYLVGAGPGDPGLLTLRGAELLVECDAVVYDALANPALLDLAKVAPRDVPVEMHDVGKRGGSVDSARQDDIIALLIRLAREGKRVVRLKGGDSFVFGRGSEEAQALAAAGVGFEVVPGVTAGIAAPAYAGIPVTHRGLSTSVTFVTGHEDPSKDATTVDWSALARAGGTIVLYMGVKSLPRIVASLLAGGMEGATPAAAIQWGTYARQRTVVATVATLAGAIAESGLSAPVITVIGPVVGLREEIGWFDRRPLFGKRVLVTRARSQAASLSARIAAQGGEVVEMPATRIEPLDPAPLDAAVRALDGYQWAVFTSQNAVRFFWQALRSAGRDARAFGSCRVAAIGPATASALLEIGVAVDLEPDRFVAEAMLEAMRAHGGLAGARVLYCCARGARDVLPAGLRESDAVVDVVPVYESVPDMEDADRLRARLVARDVDVVTFTSASAVAAFVDAVGADAARTILAVSIGPITSEAARAAGIRVVGEASPSTIDALVAAVERALAG